MDFWEISEVKKERFLSNGMLGLICRGTCVSGGLEVWINFVLSWNYYSLSHFLQSSLPPFPSPVSSLPPLPLPLTSLPGPLSFTLFTNPLICRSTASGPISANESSSRNKYSAFVPLTPSLRRMTSAKVCGDCSPKKCGFEGRAM